MARHYTTVEQSKKLLELGLSPESADMVWGSVCYEGSPENGDENGWNCYLDPSTNHFYYADLLESYSYDGDNEKKYPSIPCWSVGALRRLLPLGIKKNAQTYLFSNHNREDGSFVYLYGIDNNVYIQSTGSDINACYEIMCWLLENNYIEKDGKD